MVSTASIAQNGELAGQIIDADTGETLVGVNVVVPGTTIGGVTNLDGRYEVSLEPGTYTIVASFVGYVTVSAEIEIRTGETTTQDFEMEADLTGLEDVIVTGALSQRSRATSEVAVSRIQADQLVEVVPFNDVSQLINGKIAGVSVQPASGNVGGGIRFNIRSGGGLNGDGQPLIFIDGVRIDNAEFEGFGAGGQAVGVLSDINPEDIASIDVLKGPAASALYGTDASNGVVLIETKKGSLAAGQATGLQIDYKAVVGQNSRQVEYTEDTAFNTFEDANANFVDGGISQQTLGISGGSRSIRFFSQLDLRNEDGILPGNFQDRRSFRANVEAFPSDEVRVGVNASYTFNNVARPQNDNNIFGFLGNTVLPSAPYAFIDSLAVLGIENLTRANRFITSANVAYTPIENLTLRVTGGGDFSDLRQDVLFPQNFAYAGVQDGERNVFVREVDQITLDGVAAYTYDVVEGLVSTTTLGFQAFDRRRRNYNFDIQDFATSLITDAGTGTQFQAAGEFFDNLRQFGLLGEQSFVYDDTYSLTFGARRDYASSLGAEAADIIYPTVRGAVRFEQLDFVPEMFDLLKLRAAYGQSGQLPDVFDGIPVLYEAEVGGDGAGAVPVQVGNNEIVPERISEIEVGIDADLFNRLSLGFTYYNQRATDSIVDIIAAPSTGLVASNVPFNVGEITGQGIEFAINYTPYRDRANQVDLGLILNYQTNEVQDIGDAQPIFDGFDLNVISPGLPRSAFFTAPVNGARFNEDGTYAGVDSGVTENTDAESCDAELNRCLFGTPYPDFSGSFTANIRLLRDVRLYALVDFATGVSLFNNTRLFQVIFGNDRERSELADQLGFTTEFDDDGNVVDAGDFADLQPGSAEYIDAANRYARTDPGFDSNFVEDADFLKLREISIRYDFTRLLSKLPASYRLRTASITLAARNLFQTTNYSGPDPEVNFDGARSLSRGQDFLTIQNPRSFFATLTLGL
ncbi:MAG: carboxypeptidase-like regulatory domain-containing protein [Bacteroidota bacterium]